MRTDIILSMKLNVFLSILSCKISCNLLRAIKKGGTALPGKIALFFCKDILKHVAKNIKVILVTGTNGKTTTCRIIENGFKQARLNYFSNKSGANLLNGVITSFCLASSLTGKNRNDYAIIECDEAALSQVTEYVNPSVILITNIFRDQLDRYGEITNTLNLIIKGINKSESACLCINADCSLCTHISDLSSKKALLFGIDQKIYDNLTKEPKDALYCIKCRHPYTYDYITYAHLGGFNCLNCGYRRHNPDIHVIELINTDQKGSEILLKIVNSQYRVRVNLPGAHNIYNALAAACVLHAMKIDDLHILNAISTFESGFGRMEQIIIEDVQTNIILVKNPAGFNQILNYLSMIDNNFILVIMLNDQSADGTDVSWIYDVSFEKLLDIQDKIAHTYIGGSRAYDMALRLKYGGLDINNITIEQDDIKLLKKALAHNIPVFITPTYTAMFNLRNMLARQYSLKEFYE